MQGVTGEIEDAARRYAKLLRAVQGKLSEAKEKIATAEAEAATWKTKYKAVQDDLQSQLGEARERAESAAAEATAWKRKYKVASGVKDDLQSQLDTERQQTWALQYELQDAQEDSRVLLGYLENSIHARFQGAPGDSDDGWDNAEDGSQLPVQAYESRRARLLGKRIRHRQQGQQLESDLDATGRDDGKGMVAAASRTGTAKAKAVEDKEKLPAQGSRDASKGDRAAHSRKAPGKDWEKGKPRR
jgi:DNA repair exonuclease SbcCD ATPase subunit